MYHIIFLILSPFVLSTEGREVSWQSDNHTEMPMHHFKKLLGTNLKKSHEIDLPQVFHDLDIIKSLPDNFDARQKWTSCASLNEIRDQGTCGSCWAVSSVAAMTDRYCILSNGAKNFHFSAQDLLTCGPGDCQNGGNIYDAWQFWIDTGIVSGGNYNSGEGCRPFTIPGKQTEGKFSLGNNPISTPPCTKKCQDGYAISYEDDKHHGKTSYQITGMEHMMAEIYKNGPIVAGFNVYEDFKQYKSGEIYEHKSGNHIGGHAVKIVGWGVEGDKKYWLIANSWGTGWGMEGFFKMLRGSNECGIETTHPAVAGQL